MTNKFQRNRFVRGKGRVSIRDGEHVIYEENGVWMTDLGAGALPLGSQPFSVVDVAGPTALTVYNRSIEADTDTAGGDITITLPPEATAGNGWNVFIAKTGTAGNVIVNDDGGSTVYTLTLTGESKVFRTNGTRWFI